MEASEPADGANHERLYKHYREQLSKLKSVNGDLADTSWTLAEIEQQLAVLREQTIDPPDLALARRIADLQRWRDNLEEHVLHCLYRIDEISTTVEALRQRMGKEPADITE